MFKSNQINFSLLEDTNLGFCNSVLYRFYVAYLSNELYLRVIKNAKNYKLILGENELREFEKKLA